MNLRTFSRATALIAIALCVSAVFAGSKKTRWDEEADARKADYAYMEGLRLRALDSIESHFHLFQYAYKQDTTDIAIGEDLGYYYLRLAGRDSVLAAQGYNMLQKYFYSNPDDYYNALIYGQINEVLGNKRESLKVWEMLDSLHPDKPEIALKLSEALAVMGDSASLYRSLSVLDRIERATGKDVGLFSNRVQVLMLLGDTASIISEGASLLNALPRSSDARVYMGDLYSALGYPDSAINFYNIACELDSANGAAYYKRANFYRRQGDSIAYDREVFRALEQQELELDTKIDLLKGYVADLYDDENQHPRIEQLFNILLDEHPHDPTIHGLYGTFLWMNKDYPKAEEQYEYVVTLNPSDSGQWRFYIILCFNEQNYDKAIEVADRALVYHPDDFDIFSLKTSALQLSGRYEEAIALNKAEYEKTDSQDIIKRADLARNLGDLYQNTSTPAFATEWYETALELDPSDILTLNNYAYFLSCEGSELDRALEMAEKVITSEPLNPTYLDTYAWVLFKQKNYAEARKYIDRAMEHIDDEPTAEYLEHAGDIYFMTGEPERALEFWTEALALDGDNELLQRKVKYKTYFYN